MPLVVAENVTHGDRVVVTVNHRNRTAASGYVARLVGLIVICRLADCIPYAPKERELY